MKFLNETIVAVGLALLAYGFNVPWASYDEAEIKRIEFMVLAEKAAFTYGEYAQKVNSQIDLYNSCIKQGDKCDQVKMKKEVLDIEPDSLEWGAQTHDVLMESKKAAHLAVHYGKMKNIWTGVGIISCLLGAGLLIYGFVTSRKDKQVPKQSSGAQT